MARDNFSACLAATLKYEGGKSDDPRDPGGRTNQGVTQRTYDQFRDRKGRPRADVYGMPSAERDEIYRTGYWDVVHGDVLRPGEDLAVFDYAVNSGPARALAAWHAAGGAGAPLETVIRKVCAGRLQFLQHLNTWPVFGKGWGTRVASVEKLALGMARKPAAAPASKASTAAKAGAGAIVVATGAAAGGHDWIGGDHWMTYLIIGIGFALVLLLGLIAALAKKPKPVGEWVGPVLPPAPLPLPTQRSTPLVADPLKAGLAKLASANSAWDAAKADIAKARADMRAQAEALVALALESEKQEAEIEAPAPVEPVTTPPIAPPVAPEPEKEAAA